MVIFGKTKINATSDLEANITKYYFFKITSSLEITISVWVLFLLANHLSMTQIMTLEAFFILFVLLLEVPSGAFADLYGRKLSIILSMMCASIGFLIFAFSHTFWAYFTGQIFMAFWWSLLSGADSALLYDTLRELKREKEYTRIFGLGNFLTFLTLSVIALASSYLSVYFDYRNLFFFSSFIFFACIFIALSFKEPPVHKRLHEKNFIKHLLGAIKFAKDHAIVRSLIIYFAMFAALGHLAWIVIQPYYAESPLPEYFIGIALFLYFISAGIGFLVAEKISLMIKEEKLLVWLLAIASLSFIGIYFVNAVFALILIFIMSFTCGVRDVIISNAIHKHTDSHHRATVISIQNMSKGIMYAIFAILIGYFTDTFSSKAAFLMMGVGLFLFFAIYIFALGASTKTSD